MPDFKNDMRRLQDELKALKDQEGTLKSGFTPDQSRQLEQAISLTELAIRGELNQTQWQKATGPLMWSLGRADVAFDQRNQHTLFQINIGSLTLNQPFISQQLDPDAIGDAEIRYRRRIKEYFSEDAPYYVALAGQTTEEVKKSAEQQLPRSVRRRRRRAAAEYCEWIQQEKEIRRVKLDTLREGVDKYSCVILLGEPGCGKTTALEHLAYEFADDKNRLPIPLRLSEFGPGMRVEDFIVTGWAAAERSGQWHWETPELAACLEDYLNAGRLFFLFDALNECPRDGFSELVSALRLFIDRWTPKGNRFLVTCRVLDYGEELSGLQRIEVLPLNDEQIKTFLERELSDSWQSLWQKLTQESTERRLLEMVRNPYILTMVIDVYFEEERLGGTPVEMMKLFTDTLLKWANKKSDKQERLEVPVLKEALATLAFEIQSRAGSGTLVKTELARSVMPQQVELDPAWPPVTAPADQVLKLAADARIVEMPPDRSSLRFYHQLLQEYFAAQEMLKRDPAVMTDFWRWPWLEKEMPKWIRPKDNWDPLPSPPPTGWEETTIMAAGLAPKNDDQLVQSLLEVNPVLAGRCLHEGRAKVGSDIREKVVDRLLAAISEKHRGQVFILDIYFPMSYKDPNHLKQMG
jgi:hypothetical protein